MNFDKLTPDQFNAHLAGVASVCGHLDESGKLFKPLTDLNLVNSMMEHFKPSIAVASKMWCADDISFLYYLLTHSRKDSRIVFSFQKIHRTFVESVLRESGDCGRGIQDNGLPVGVKLLCYNSVLESELETPIYAEAKIMKFDIVVGNPPYQGGSEGSNSIWKKFIQISFETLVPEGHLAFVTPQGWLNDTKAKSILEKKNLIFADMDCAKYFKGVGSSFSWWYATNQPQQEDTVMVTDGKFVSFRLDELQTFPAKCMSAESISIHKKILSFKPYEILWQGNKRDVSKVETAEYCFPAYNTKAQPKVWLREDRFTKVKKVILQSVSTFSPFYDDGTIGVARQSGLIVVKNRESGDNLVSFLNSKLMRFIHTSIKTDGFNPMRHVPQIDLSRAYSDQEIYAYFKLTQAEIAFIEKAV